MAPAACSGWPTIAGRDHLEDRFSGVHRAFDFLTPSAIAAVLPMAHCSMPGPTFRAGFADYRLHVAFGIIVYKVAAAALLSIAQFWV